MAVIPADENEFPKVLFTEGAAPAAPATGLVIQYAKSDGLLYSKDDAGAESALGAAAHIADTTDAHDASAVSVDPTGLSVVAGTDVQTAIEELDAGISGGGIPATIVDAAGDLIVGTAADTVARFAIGAAGGHLSRINGALAWDSGTSNPGSAAAGDRFWRTDIHGGLPIFYDGTRWLSQQLFMLHDKVEGSVSATSAVTFTGPFGTYDLFIERMAVSAHVSTTNNGTHHWTIGLERNVLNTWVAVGSAVSTAAQAADDWTLLTTDLDTVITLANYAVFRALITKVSSPGTFTGGATMYYRLVIP